jgi:hypothetical protein
MKSSQTMAVRAVCSAKQLTELVEVVRLQGDLLLFLEFVVAGGGRLIEALRRDVERHSMS